MDLVLDKQEPRFDIINQTFVSSTNATQELDEQEDDFEDDILIEEVFEEDDILDDPLLQPKESPRENTVSEEKNNHEMKGELLYIMLVARSDRPYTGYELLQALLSCGLRFGAMDLFHRYEDLNGKGKILFSVASASETGTFEINKMGAYSAKGLMMFLRLSKEKELMPAFDSMIETARELVEDLGGEILDDERKILTPTKIESMRKTIVDFEKRQLMGDLFDT